MLRPIKTDLVEAGYQGRLALETPPQAQGRDLIHATRPTMVQVTAYDSILKVLFNVARRYWWVMVLAVLLTSGFAAIESLLIRPVFAAEASIVIDPGQHDALDTTAPSGAPPDDALLNTEISLIGSEDVASATVDELNLAADPEFAPKPKRGKPMDAAAKHEAVVAKLMTKVSVRRDGSSYLVRVQARSTSAVKAAAIANAIAEQYLSYNQAQKIAAAVAQQKALSGSANDLQQQAEAASADVARYKAQAGLVDAGGANGANGTVTDQQAQTLAAQLALANAQAATDGGKADTARDQVAKGALDAVPDVVSSTVITDMRRQRTELVAEQAKINAQYLPTHPESLRVAQQIRQIDAQIAAEASRIVTSLQSQAAASGQRVATLQAQLNGLEGRQKQNAQASVQAQSLQRRADTLNTISSATSQVVERASQQAQVGRSQARIASLARTPLKPTSPNKPLIVMLGFTLGIVIGAVMIFLIEMFDSGLKTAQDVETHLGLSHFASLPLTPPTYRQRGVGNRHKPVWDYVIDKPVSGFAESLRSTRRSLQLRGPSAKIVTVTSALPGEGKTSTAVSLARVMAQSGDRVLLIDCDLRRNSMAKLLKSVPEIGLMEVLSGKSAIADALIQDIVPGVDIIPLVAVSYTAEDVFGNGAMADMLRRLRIDYDHIILDAPPVLAVADARQLAALSDATLLIVRWAKTSQDAVRAAVNRLEGDGAVISGVILAGVNVNARAYLGKNDAYYYHNAYKSYYVDN